jgi:hypothetical protein
VPRYRDHVTTIVRDGDHMTAVPCLVTAIT